MNLDMPEKSGGIWWDAKSVSPVTLLRKRIKAYQGKAPLSCEKTSRLVCLYWWTAQKCENNMASVVVTFDKHCSCLMMC